jgi:hypothetical protein
MWHSADHLDGGYVLTCPRFPTRFMSAPLD